MRAFTFILVLFLCASLRPLALAQEATSIILVRHAEKTQDGTTDPPLSEIGIKRAKALAKFLTNTELDAIYSTNYKRTKSTVEPTAEQKGLEVNIYDAFKEEAIDDMISQHKSKTILIVGHSNNIPWIANYLTGKKDNPDWKENEYDNIWVVNVDRRGKANIVKFSFPSSE